VNGALESSCRLYDGITSSNQVANTVNWIVKLNVLSGQYILTTILSFMHTTLSLRIFYIQQISLLKIPSTGMQLNVCLEVCNTKEEINSWKYIEYFLQVEISLIRNHIKSCVYILHPFFEPRF
jgi:hypothetical protein